MTTRKVLILRANYFIKFSNILAEALKENFPHLEISVVPIEGDLREQIVSINNFLAEDTVIILDDILHFDGTPTYQKYPFYGAEIHSYYEHEPKVTGWISTAGNISLEDDLERFQIPYNPTYLQVPRFNKWTQFKTLAVLSHLDSVLTDNRSTLSLRQSAEDGLREHGEALSQILSMNLL